MTALPGKVNRAKSGREFFIIIKMQQFDQDRVSLKPDRKDGAFSVLQITDTHLFGKPGSTLVGIDTRKSLLAVVAAVKEQGIPFDFIVTTGDLSQDYTLESYIAFRDIMRAFSEPVFFLPGNHDDGPLMYREMAGLGISAARNIIIGKWQFVLLNTQVYNNPMGWILPEQLAYLEGCLEERPDLYTAVCLHHNPFEVKCLWLDAHVLKNRDDLISLVSRYPRVRLVLCGHVHQEHDFIQNGVRYISSPSTSIQFAPLCDRFTLDALGPGWRYLKFTPDGGISTTVHRLAGGEFLPDFTVGGY